MAEAKNQVTPEEVEANKLADFARAEERRQLMRERRDAMGGAPDMSHEFDWSAPAPPGRPALPACDEPTFTFRAQDILSVLVLDEYARLLERYDPVSEKLARVTDELNKFRDWQRSNPGKVKLPD